LIFAYAKKELSHQSDILNAFAGVADMMRYDCETELFYGLVSWGLTNSMLWRLSDPPGSRRTGFPSWSWCGWQGGVDGPSVKNLSKWTTKYSWIDWYICDGSHQFRLLPQKQWQPEDDVDPFDIFNPSGPRFVPPEKRTPRLDRLCEPPDTKVSETSASVPQYLTLLRKHGLNSTKTSPSTFNVKDMKISPSASLSGHTLYFKTLSTTVYMSAYDPFGQRMYPDVHLYDLSHRYLGVAKINLNSLDTRKNGNGDLTHLYPNKRRINIAVLSGPCSAHNLTRRSMWLGQYLERLRIQAKVNPVFYQVLLLKHHTPPSDKPVIGVYERVGLGEIPAGALERLDGLNWEDILLQ